MQEKDISVFHIEELDCEIKHTVLQPCYFCFSLLGVPLLRTYSIYEDIQRDKKSPVTKTKSKQTNEKAIGRRLKSAEVW